MLFKLAFRNIKKSIKDYSIYFATLVIGVSIFYIFNSLDAQESMLIMNESRYEIVKSLVSLLGYLSVFISIILGFLIVYSNNFLIKRRKKEFGLYLTLGMSKRKVSMILVVETLLVGIISLIVGLLLGIFLSQFLSIFIAKLFEADMNSFKFIFSKYSLVKTVIYFGMIFVLVMIFNIITLSKNKLINLLTAKNKNEKVKMRNKYVIFISFILAIGLLYYAYKLLFDGALFALEVDALYMIIAGALGTYFLFFSVAGVFLKIAEKCKKFYCKNLNMFLVKQINSKANTSVLSTTIISLMLLLTIGILSGSISMVSVFNEDLNSNNRTDISIIKNLITTVVEEDGNMRNVENNYDMSDFIKQDFFDDYIEDYTVYKLFSDKNVIMMDLIDDETKNNIKKEYGNEVSLNTPLDIIGESDYNRMLDLYDMSDKKVDIKEDEYLLTVNIDKAIEFYKKEYKNGKILKINNKDLKPHSNEIVDISFKNYSGASNFGTLVVDDSVTNGMTSYLITLLGNYVKTDNVEKLETEFLKKCDEYATYNEDTTSVMAVESITKLDMTNTSIGIKAIMTFVGLYLGIIFAIASATTLAIGQLSEASDNKERYKVLRQIGADEKSIRRTLLTQILVAFALPLIVALFHAYFGLRELNGIIELMGSIDLSQNIFLTTIFIIIVYGGYFLATYLCSRNIIKE